MAGLSSAGTIVGRLRTKTCPPSPPSPKRDIALVFGVKTLIAFEPSFLINVEDIWLSAEPHIESGFATSHVSMDIDAVYH